MSLVTPYCLLICRFPLYLSVFLVYLLKKLGYLIHSFPDFTEFIPLYSFTWFSIFIIY